MRAQALEQNMEAAQARTVELEAELAVLTTELDSSRQRCDLTETQNTALSQRVADLESRIGITQTAIVDLEAKLSTSKQHGDTADADVKTCLRKITELEAQLERSQQRGGLAEKRAQRLERYCNQHDASFRREKAEWGY